MSDLITFNEIHEQYGVARTTIYRRLEALGFKTYKKRVKERGQPSKAMRLDQVEELINYNIKEAKRREEEALNEWKKEQAVQEEKQNIARDITNREMGYYMTIQPYEMLNCFQGGHA